jgi:hypothetical protein
MIVPGIHPLKAADSNEVCMLHYTPRFIRIHIIVLEMKLHTDIHYGFILCTCARIYNASQPVHGVAQHSDYGMG